MVEEFLSFQMNWFKVWTKFLCCQDIDVGLMLKLQNRVKELEKEKSEMQKQLEKNEDEKQKPTSGEDVITDSAFNALKV